MPAIGQIGVRYAGARSNDRRAAQPIRRARLDRRDERVEPRRLGYTTARTRRVQVVGEPGLLLRGRHVVMFQRPGQAPIVAEPRPAKNTLLWERGELLLRIEAEQPPGELLRLARSAR